MVAKGKTTPTIASATGKTVSHAKPTPAKQLSRSKAGAALRLIGTAEKLPAAVA
jgi:hypothetical protein